jgi:hypothetical protein
MGDSHLLFFASLTWRTPIGSENDAELPLITPETGGGRNEGSALRRLVGLIGVLTGSHPMAQ